MPKSKFSIGSTGDCKKCTCPIMLRCVSFRALGWMSRSWRCEASWSEFSRFSHFLHAATAKEEVRPCYSISLQELLKAAVHTRHRQETNLQEEQQVWIIFTGPQIKTCLPQASPAQCQDLVVVDECKKQGVEGQEEEGVVVKVVVEQTGQVGECLTMICVVLICVVLYNSCQSTCKLQD